MSKSDVIVKSVEKINETLERIEADVSTLKRIVTKPERETEWPTC